MDYSFLFFISSGLFLGWSLGANDAANIFGTAVGTKMVKFRTAAIIASVFVMLGAVYAGSGASNTLGDLGSINAIAGAFMTALAAAITVYWMVYSGLTVSTTQAIVGAIVGWNLYSGTPTDISTLSKIVSTWVLCPALSGGFAIVIYFAVRWAIKHSRIHLVSLDFYTRVALIVTGAFGAYALGANNIANVMGAFVDANPFKDITVSKFTFNKTQVLFFMGSIAISVGIFTYSHKVMATIGKNIMSMSPQVAWIVVFAKLFDRYAPSADSFGAGFQFSGCYRLGYRYRHSQRRTRNQMGNPRTYCLRLGNHPARRLSNLLYLTVFP